MGCPPDPIEASVHNHASQISESVDKYRQLVSELDECNMVITRFQSGIPLSGKAAEHLSPARDKFTFPSLAIFDNSMVYKTENYQEVFSEIYSVLRRNEDAIKQVENRLCILRHSLLKAAEEVAAQVASPLKEAIARQKELHMAHREDDRRTWIKWLEEKLNLHQYFLEEGGDHDKKEAMEKIPMIESEITRVQELSIEELLENRDAFGRNCEIFGKSHGRS